MKLTMTREALCRALSTVQGVVERRPLVPINGHALLVAKGHGLRISATDGEVSLSGEFPAEVTGPGSIAVAARQAYDVARALPPGEVSLHLQKAQLEVRCGQSRFRLATLPADTFPPLPKASATESWTLPAAALGRMVERTLFCVSPDDSRHNLAGVHFEAVDGDVLRLVATDGHRLALAEGPVDGLALPKDGVLVPKKGLTELRRVLSDQGKDEAVSVGLTSHGAVFTCGTTIITTRLIDAVFPDYRQVLPEGGDNRATVDRAVLTDALKRVSLLSQAKAHGVRLTFSEGSLLLEAEDPEQGDARDEMPVAYAGPKVVVGFNARYLLDALALMDKGDVEVRLSDEMSPVVMLPADEGGFTAVVMPMRV